MDHPKTLSAALCRIFNEVGAAAWSNPERLPALLADFAPNLKAERVQIELLSKSGCARQLSAAPGLSDDSIQRLIASAVATLSNDYLMDPRKAEELCRIYVCALNGQTYVADAAPTAAAPAPQQPQATAQPQFRMNVEDVFRIVGRGMVVTGRVRGTSVRVGDSVILVCAGGAQHTATVQGIESHQTLRDKADPGDAVGILLSGLRPGDIHAGDLLVAAPAFHRAGTAIEIPRFQMDIDGAFLVPGRGMVVTGWVLGASIRVGNAVTVLRANGTQRTATVRGIESNHTLLDRADPGDAVGILLHGLKESEVAVGDRLVFFAW